VVSLEAGGVQKGRPGRRKIHVDQHPHSGHAGEIDFALLQPPCCEAKCLEHILTFDIRIIPSSSSMLRPAPICPTIMPTVTRCPRMQGLPPMTAGSWVMRGNGFMRAFLVHCRLAS
jgi:hypothetical protein